MIDQVVWLIANVAATSHTLKKKMLSETYITQEIYKYVIQNQNIKKGVLKTFLWCLSNLCKPSDDDVETHLTHEETSQMV